MTFVSECQHPESTAYRTKSTFGGGISKHHKAVEFDSHSHKEVISRLDNFQSESRSHDGVP